VVGLGWLLASGVYFFVTLKTSLHPDTRGQESDRREAPKNR